MSTVKVLVVAGGGGGGFQIGGGGGAGGYIEDNAFVVTPQAYTVTVGNGGAGATSNAAAGVNGQNSVFESLTAVGGGGGGSNTGGAPGNGQSGGSTGGAGEGSTVGSATSGQGHVGGAAATNGSGGGGGATGTGAGASGDNGGNGGAGTASSISGSSVTRAGGGGGGAFDDAGAAAGGTGGAGGGGKGGDSTGITGTNGTVNTGSGGGGGGFDVNLGSGGNGGAGGSGVVIIRYVTADFGSCTGGTITTDGSDTIHTFTSSGTFTLVAAIPGVAFTARRGRFIELPRAARRNPFADRSPALWLPPPEPPVANGPLRPHRSRHFRRPSASRGTIPFNLIANTDYFYGLPWIEVAGVQRAFGRTEGNGSIDCASLSITERQGDIPSTCTFIARGFVPVVGTSIEVTLGSETLQNPEPIFAGQALQVQQMYSAKPANVCFRVSAVDWTWQLGKLTVSKQYTGWRPNHIAIDLMETYAPGFTCGNVHGGFDVIDKITFARGSTLAACLKQLAKAAGAKQYIDYRKDLHFYIRENLMSPQPLTASHPSLVWSSATSDIGQWITRAISEGGGSDAATAVAAGETILPVHDASWYEDDGGFVNSGANRISYTGRVAGGSGSLVGPGAAPAAAPALALASGSGVESGEHKYAVIFKTAAGTSIASPIGTITVGAIALPGSAPTVSAPTTGGSVTPGSHDYVVTFTNAAGETPPGPISASVTATGQVSTPGAGMSGTVTANSTGCDIGDHWIIVTFVTATGETPFSTASMALVNVPDSGHRAILLSNIPISPYSGVTKRRLYITKAGAAHASATDFWTFAGNTAFEINDNTTTASVIPIQADDAQLNLGSHPPTSNTTEVTGGTIPVSAIPLGPATTTGRNLYRRFNGTGTFKFVGSIPNNSGTTFSDTVANGSLGAAAPSVNTATANQVAVSSIPIGGATVTERWVYRSAANLSQLKLLAVIPNNTATTLTDSTADASLGADVPTSDTSGLTQPTGQIVTGSSSILVAGTGWASASGGWAVIGNGQQVIRYTGFSGGSITGIPATGPGAILASITYGSTITASPALVGVPASGDGAIAYDIVQGDEVNLLAVVDDLAGQAALSALLDPSNLLGGRAGIVENYQNDGRISYVEALARANARLELHNSIAVALKYACRDPITGSGLPVTVDLPAPTSVAGEFEIQRVTITSFSDKNPNLFPLYTVEASSELLTIDDLLRVARSQPQ